MAMKAHGSSYLACAGLFAGFLMVADAGAAGLANAVAPKERPAPTAHEKCDGCNAQDVWHGFLDHLVETGRSDLAPPGALEALEASRAEAPKERSKDDPPAPKVDLQATDPIRGVLFRMSKDFVNLDALVTESQGKPLEGADREKAAALAEKLRGSEDPYLKAYGELHGARLDLDAGKADPAAGALEKLVESHHFLPKREARRLLSRAYRARGDDTLALLELQFFLEDLPAGNETDRAWARDELRRIRETKHEGPLHDSGKSMKSISGLIEGHEVGDGTQSKERRVEDILQKVAKLLEQKAARLSLSMASQSSSSSQKGAKGRKPGGKSKDGKDGKGKDGRDPKDGDGKGKANDPSSPNESDEVATAEGQASLRDATPDEKDAWGKINDRDVSRSLKELWDKIPPRYRMAVIEYFRDVGEEE
jgi:hypothetical protein